ncbi:acyltransferase family protein [Hamadaea tsunoensis]|uniref:acyltransferase family protein n=1 Tax=Hamadaea tsunoensis TaxID=53368 RepID=UPI000419EE4B|nr:acyltransferase [Hamadaea tsunoensis]
MPHPSATDTTSAGQSPLKTASQPTEPARTQSRLGWLDALRGFAAVVVLFSHYEPRAFGAVLDPALSHLHIGLYGVLVFFFVSGYVIPMSLERKESLRGFWIGRVFRLYPAWALSILLWAAVTLATQSHLPAYATDHAATSAVAHLTMLQETLNVRGYTVVLWTLSMEMMFYLICSGLAATGLLRFSPTWLVTLCGLALAAGWTLPAHYLTHDPALRRDIVLVVATLLAAVLAAFLTGRRTLALPAGILGLGALALPIISYLPTSNFLLWLSIMFGGMVVYHAHHGKISRRTAAIALFALAIAGTVDRWRPDFPKDWQIQVATFWLAAATFAVGFLLRHRQPTRVLRWLGRISYSVYLLHIVVLQPFDATILGWGPGPRSVLAVLGLAAATLLLADLSYRFVELPGQRLGVRLTRWFEQRFGPDRGLPRTPKVTIISQPAVRSAPEDSKMPV